jgi:hypothetical protein
VTKEKQERKSKADQERQLSDELTQSFPASDPPASHSPGVGSPGLRRSGRR